MKHNFFYCLINFTQALCNGQSNSHFAYSLLAGGVASCQLLYRANQKREKIEMTLLKLESLQQCKKISPNKL